MEEDESRKTTSVPAETLPQEITRNVETLPTAVSNGEQAPVATPRTSAVASEEGSVSTSLESSSDSRSSEISTDKVLESFLKPESPDGDQSTLSVSAAEHPTTGTEYVEPVATTEVSRESATTGKVYVEPVATTEVSRESVTTGTEYVEPVATTAVSRESGTTGTECVEPVATTEVTSESVTTGTPTVSGTSGTVNMTDYVVQSSDESEQLPDALGEPTLSDSSTEIPGELGYDTSVDSLATTSLETSTSTPPKAGETDVILYTADQADVQSSRTYLMDNAVSDTGASPCVDKAEEETRSGNVITAMETDAPHAASKETSVPEITEDTVTSAESNRMPIAKPLDNVFAGKDTIVAEDVVVTQVGTDDVDATVAAEGAEDSGPQEETQKDLSPEVQHGPVATIPRSAAGTEVLPTLSSAAGSTGPQEIGVRGTMDALLALDSLTAPISSKLPPVHGYSHSSLSDTSLSPPPSFSRLPPDGHEFPPNYQEPNHFSVGVPALIEMEVPLDKTVSSHEDTDSRMPPDTLLSSPPPLPSSGPPTRKPSIGQELELVPSPNRKLSTSSMSSSNEEIAARSPIRSLPWRKDEKSERSVRDKIAMFSNAQDGQTSVIPSHRRLSKYSSSEDVFYQDDVTDNASVTLPSGKMLSRSVLSVDKIGQRSPLTSHHQSDLAPNLTATHNGLYKNTSPVYNSSSDVSSITSVTSMDTGNAPKSLDYTTRTQSYMDLPSSSSSAYSSGSPDSSLSSTTSAYTLGYSSTLPRKVNQNRHSAASVGSSLSTEINQKSNAAPSLYRRTSFSGATGSSNLHSRSQSLVDVGAIPSTKRNSIAGYKATAEDMRKASLNALIEQRRRGFSKLRGLIIPERPETTTNQAIVDLPEIKSRDSILSSKPSLLSKDDSKSHFMSHSNSVTNRWGTATFSPLDKTGAVTNMSATNLTSLPWKSETPIANLPKYSPAFKRKSLSLYGVSSSASSVSSSLSSSREELRPLFDNTTNNVPKSCPPPLPPMKPPRNATSVGNSLTKSAASPSYSPAVPSSLLPHLEPPKSLESITSPTRSDLSFEFLSSNSSSPDLRNTTLTCSKDELVHSNTVKRSLGKITNGEVYGKNPKGNPNHSEKGILPSDIGRSAAEDDSDNDSAVSSSRSSISHGFSPPPSPLPDSTGTPHRSFGDHNSARQQLESITGSDPDKRPLRRTLSSETTASAASSTASTLTSGSQASCSSNVSSGSDINKRVLKAQSVEAINRKNVLSSARYSSGRDLKVGSPLIQRKFDDEEDQITPKDSHAASHLAATRKSDNYDGSEESVYKSKISHGDGDTKGLDASHGIVHYKMSSSESVPDGTVKMAYLEVEETEFTRRPDDSLDGCSLPSQESDVGIEAVIEAESFPPHTTAPQPAPRHTITPTLPGKIPQNNENVNSKQKDSEGYASAAKVQSYGADKIEDEVFRFEKKGFAKHEIELGSLPFSADNQNGSAGPIKTSNISSLSNNTTNARVPVVPPKPKPVQRRSSLKGGSPVDEVSNIEPESTSDDNLIDILTGRSGKQDHSAIRIRERQKSRDAEPLQTVGKETEPDRTLLSGSRKSSSSAEQPTSPSSRLPVQSSRNLNSRRSVSVNDIKKAFEKAELALANSGRAVTNSNVKTASNGLSSNHVRVSSLDSTASEDSMVPPLARYGSASNLHREQYGSITSLASSSTSLISQQELQTLIDEANQSIEESGGFCTPVQEVLVVILHRETPGGSVGITLAGGADYEAKEITVHKVLAGSLADRDGRIQKGDRILSINGRSMKNVTHKESLEILKAPRHEVVLVVSRSRSDGSGSAPEEVHSSSIRTSLSGSSSRPPRILEQLAESAPDPSTEDSQDDVVRGPPVTIILKKDGAGLGFSLEGGKDSPMGDKPLTIKKIFTGGAAEKHGQLTAGDELLVMNGKDLTVMSRIEAWSLMKRLPDGNVTLTVRCKVNKK